MHKATIVSCLILISLSCCMSYYVQGSKKGSDPLGRRLAAYLSAKTKKCPEKPPAIFIGLPCKFDANCDVLCKNMNMPDFAFEDADEDFDYYYKLSAEGGGEYIQTYEPYEPEEVITEIY